MLFSSTTFIFLFLPVSLLVYYTVLRKNRNLQNVFLCLVSLFFYAWGEPAFVFVMLASIVLNYIFGLLIGNEKQKENPDDKKTKSVLIISVIVNLSVLFVFKYLGFTVENINSIISGNLTVPEIALPIGVSFFTFQAMSYVIDVYRGKPYQKKLLNVGLYISFFPQLIAGPIVRYETVVEQINNRKETFDDFSDGVSRFIIGLGKKVLLSNTLAVIADNVFDNSIDNLVISAAWLGAIAYTFQIFFDFSGYSDMAIGLGKMFGFHFLENFNYPYISTSLTEFWRRWHISLGTWFKDYLYFPLGGSRVKSKSRLIFNLFVVWFLTGLWHGANWTFIVWGLLYFVLLVFEKLTGLHKCKKFILLRWIYSMLFVIIGWVIFRAENLEYALKYISVMFGGSGFSVDDFSLFFLKENIVCFVIAIFASTPILKNIKNRFFTNKTGEVLSVISVLFVFAISIIYIVKGTYNPFIYFNF